jgi:hypothetical protein
MVSGHAVKELNSGHPENNPDNFSLKFLFTDSCLPHFGGRLLRLSLLIACGGFRQSLNPWCVDTGRYGVSHRNPFLRECRQRTNQMENF